jgi:hypothetical protein
MKKNKNLIVSQTAIDFTDSNTLFENKQTSD